MSRSLFVVGDDAQSIYGFRGSKIELILDFQKHYPKAQEIILNQNYRSIQPILDLAEQILTLNPNQKKKSLFTNNTTNDLQVHYYLARNERDEAEYIVRRLIELYAENQVPVEKNTAVAEVTFVSDSKQRPHSISSMFDIYLDSNDINLQPNSYPSFNSGYQSNSWQVPAVDWREVEELNNCVILYRTHSQSRSIEEVFIRSKLPYKLVSGTRFLDRREIKDILSILRFVSNGSEKVALGRFLPLILDGVGAKTVDKILAYLDDFDYPLAPKNQQQINNLLEQIQSCWQRHTNLIDMTKELLLAIGYMRYLKSEFPIKEEFQARMENIGEIYSLMLPFEEDPDLDLAGKLQQFLTHITLITQAESNDDGQNQVPKISLMTLHQSKGLEFESVFLVGCEDGLLPHQNSFFENGGMEEEVRLAYVGVTRAKKNLHILAADSRVQFGQIKANPVSRIFRPFLDKFAKRVK